MQADPIFGEVLLPISTRNELVPVKDRITLFFPTDAAVQEASKYTSLTTEDMLPVRAPDSSSNGTYFGVLGLLTAYERLLTLMNAY